jgi:hypothetical protein
MTWVSPCRALRCCGCGARGVYPCESQRVFGWEHPMLLNRKSHNWRYDSYGTYPPFRKHLRSRRFSSATRSRSTFRGKGQGKCTWSMPDGTIRRSFSPTAAGGVEGGILPPGSKRYESRLEPSPRTRGYATLRRTSCLCPARRPANCQGAKAVRQQHGCLAACTFSLLGLRAPPPQSAQTAADAAPRWHHLGWKSPPCSQARLERPI